MQLSTFSYARDLSDFSCRFAKPTQHATRNVYAFVPVVPLDQEWTDAKLYQRYALGPEEIAFIESQVAANDGELFDDDASVEADDE